MLNQSAFTFMNPQNGNLVFKLFSFDDNGFFETIQRNNYFSLIWIMEGNGRLTADFAEYDFTENSLLAFAPYQPFMITDERPIKGKAIYFHPEFFCIHKHQEEIGSNGVLYNNVYQPPFVKVDDVSEAAFKMLFHQIETEMQSPALAQYELLVSYLKIILITASRLKIEQQPLAAEKVKDHKEPFILQKLKDAIEKNFKTKHSPADYAEMLYISPKALAKITKSHFNKTLSSLINERIIIEAKRELYLTNKTVKEIGYELGYDDEYYFSRFFKVNAEVSPQLYRETVGFARAEA
ncbi:MAG: helix-turn-helix domain-containing protein [Ginsengibacter sp.]